MTFLHPLHLFNFSNNFKILSLLPYAGKSGNWDLNKNNLVVRRWNYDEMKENLKILPLIGSHVRIRKDKRKHVIKEVYTWTENVSSIKEFALNVNHKLGFYVFREKIKKYM